MDCILCILKKVLKYFREKYININYNKFLYKLF